VRFIGQTQIDKLGPVVVKAGCIRLKVASEFAISDYMLLPLNSPSTQNRPKKMIHGIGRPRLNLGEIKSIVNYACEWTVWRSLRRSHWWRLVLRVFDSQQPQHSGEWLIWISKGGAKS